MAIVRWIVNKVMKKGAEKLRKQRETVKYGKS